MPYLKRISVNSAQLVMQVPPWRKALGYVFLTTCLLQTPCHALLVLQVEQVGGGVRVTGTGTANTTALIGELTASAWTSALTDAQIYAGPLAFNDGQVSLYSGLLGPLFFGSDPGVYELPDAMSSGGDLFGILADNGSGSSWIVLPAGYTSGNSLGGSSNFPGLTLAQIGLVPGQQSTWSWGSGPDADSLRLEVVPAPAPLLAVPAGWQVVRSLRRRLRATTAKSPS